METYLSFFGIFLLLPNLIYIVVMIISLFCIHMRITIEERFLRDRFKIKYENYCRNVPSYLLRLSIGTNYKRQQ